MEFQKEPYLHRIGFVGLGSLGLPIASNLVKSGYSLKVHTRSRSAEFSPSIYPSIPCDNPSEVSKDVDILMICVSDDAAVRNVLFGDDGAIPNLAPGSVVIDLSTISHKTSEEVAQRLSSYGVNYIDSPVTGGTEGAKQGKLTILLGGKREVVDQVANVFDVIGESYHYFGPVGSGQKVKSINQILVAGCYAALAEAIALGQHQKLPMRKVVNALMSGAGGSWALRNRSTAMINNKYPLGFKLSLHYKDLAIALDSAHSLGLELMVTEQVKNLEEKLLAVGFGDQDISVLRRSITD